MRNFIGRLEYLDRFEALWKQRKTHLISVYGRRRVGKTELIKQFGKEKRSLYLEGLEGQDTPSQIKHLLGILSVFYGESHLKDIEYKDWRPFFDLLTSKIKSENEMVLVFDELPWMSSGRTKLMSYLKYYWDTHWKYHPHLMIILCGSVASWMVKNVVKSTALYGRIRENFLIEPLKPFEVASFIGKKRGQKESLEYILCFGGIPRYLEEFDFNQSLALNVDRTCFQKSGFFKEEAQKIFYSQFKETRVYEQIVGHLLKKSMTLDEISQKLKMPSGGGLKQYLNNLSFSNIIDQIFQIQNFKLGKTCRYYMTDEFLRFHHWFIKSHEDEINHSGASLKFQKFTQGKWAPFLGLSFERFCLKNRYQIAELMGFGQHVIGCGPVLSQVLNGFQYDLVYLRNDDVVTICEIKYVTEPLGTTIIREMESKMSKTHFPKNQTIERVLICNQEPKKALEESGFFHRILLAQEIINFQSKS